MKYVLGILAVVVVAILAIVLISSPKKSSTTTTKNTINLVDYVDKNSKVTLTTQGKVVGDDQYKEIRITVTPSERTVEVLSSYDEHTEKSEVLKNTQTAYDIFLRSLARSGYTTARTSTFKDERGVCPQGNRYIYELTSDSKQVSRLWSTSCGSQGTLSSASGSVIRQLFQAQISDYGKFTNAINL